MGLSREEITDIARSTAQAVLEGLHRYTVAYKEPETIDQGLQESMVEERTAADWYRKRAEHAFKQMPTSGIGETYEHIAVEEDQHYEEFHAELQKVSKTVRDIAPEIHRKYVEGGGYVPPSSLEAVRDYWDTFLENNPLRTGVKDTDAGAFLASMIMDAGDILREYCRNRDGGYMMAKLYSIKRALKYPKDWRDSLTVGELQRLEETEKLLEGLPIGDQTTHLIKNLLSSICDRIVERVEFYLNQLEPLLKATKPVMGS